MTGNAADGWRLGERQGTSVGEVAWEVFGEGPPVVLVHGTPSRSYIWRNVVPALGERHSVYTYDLLGYGESEQAEGQEVSILAQACLLKELVGAWGLDRPAIAGHDIGGGIVLGAHLIEGVRFARIALLDAVTLSPWLSQANSSTRHIAEHREAYATMPEHFFEAVFSVYLEESGTRLSEDTFETFLSQWRGEEGRRAFARQAASSPVPLRFWAFPRCAGSGSRASEVPWLASSHRPLKSDKELGPEVLPLRASIPNARPAEGVAPRDGAQVPPPLSESAPEVLSRKSGQGHRSDSESLISYWPSPPRRSKSCGARRRRLRKLRRPRP